MYGSDKGGVILKEALDFAVQWYQSFNGTGFYHVLYLIGLLWVIRDRKIEKQWKYLFAGYTILFLFLYYFPVTAKIILTLIGTDVYWRMFWILPITVLLAMTAAQFVDGEKKSTWKRLGCIAAATAVLVMSGRNLYLNGGFIKAENSQKIMEETVMVCQVMKKYQESKEEIRAAVPDEILYEIRQFDASILLPYGRWPHEYPEKQELMDAMHAQPVQPHVLAEELRKSECNYLVYPAADGLMEAMEEEGFTFLEAVGNYQIYKDMK